MKTITNIIKLGIIGLGLMVLIPFGLHTLPRYLESQKENKQLIEDLNEAFADSKQTKIQRVKNKRITYAQFEEIRTGMTKEEVTEIFGSEGKLISSNELNGLVTEMYQWDNGGISMQLVHIYFQNYQVTMKTQVGLK